jgi:hypothetical protein
MENFHFYHFCLVMKLKPSPNSSTVNTSATLFLKHIQWHREDYFRGALPFFVCWRLLFAASKANQHDTVPSMVGHSVAIIAAIIMVKQPAPL